MGFKVTAKKPLEQTEHGEMGAEEQGKNMGTLAEKKKKS